MSIVIGGILPGPRLKVPVYAGSAVSATTQGTSSHSQSLAGYFKKVAEANASKKGEVHQTYRTPSKWDCTYTKVINPDRDRDETTLIALRWLQPKPGMTIADIGAGAGYFAFKFAELVGSGGCVIATDVDREIVHHMKEIKRAWNIFNVVPTLVLPHQLGLPDNRVDRMLIVDVNLFRECCQAQNDDYLLQIWRSLRPGGRVLIINAYCGSATCDAGQSEGEAPLKYQPMLDTFSQRLRILKSKSVAYGQGDQWDMRRYILAGK